MRVPGFGTARGRSDGRGDSTADDAVEDHMEFSDIAEIWEWAEYF